MSGWILDGIGEEVIDRDKIIERLRHTLDAAVTDLEDTTAILEMLLSYLEQATMRLKMASISGLSIVYCARGLARQTKGDLGNAIADFDQAIALNPERASAYFNRGIARQDQGDLDATIADFNQAIVLIPDGLDKATVFKNRGNARYYQGDLDAAIYDYTKAITHNPTYAIAYYNRGNARYDLRDLDNAIHDYSQAIALFPDSIDRAEAYNNRGFAHTAQDDLDAAIQDYDKAITLNHDHIYAHSNRDIALRQHSDLAGVTPPPSARRIPL